MADIRINALATTAASTASDDFVAVDGSANGTRKLNAYSPTFGGNLTVSGTGDSSFAIDNSHFLALDSGNLRIRSNGYLSSQSNVGTILASNAYYSTNWTGTGTGTFLYLGVSGGAEQSKIYLGGTSSGSPTVKFTLDTSTGAATLAGNLTVSGTGTSSFGGVVQVSNTLAAKETNASLTLQPGPGTGGINYAFGQGTGDHVWYGGTTERMRLGYGGNLLIGTTTDTGQRLQVSGEVAATKSFWSSGYTSAPADSTTRAILGVSGGTAFLQCLTGTTNSPLSIDGSTVTLRTGSYTTALTLDSSQNATFAGSIAIGNAVQTAVSVASTHKVTISIGGTTYYLLATNV